MTEATQRYAVVTGANKGIGLEICKQLASNGINVVLTARDEERGLEAVQKLKDCGLADHVVFHQLDVTDQVSVDSLADFVRTQFGKLDILVNNAGVAGVKATNIGNGDILIDLMMRKEEALGKWKELSAETPELAKECLNINYYGSKKMVEAHISLLQLSDSPKIVNVSSIMGMLKEIPNEEAKSVLGDANNLAEERVEYILNEYLKDFKEGSLETKDWPACYSAYALSKAAVNAYTRIVAKKYPSLRINSVCPGFVKTDINLNVGHLSAKEGAESIVKVALLQNGGPSGCFFHRQEQVSF